MTKQKKVKKPKSKKKVSAIFNKFASDGRPIVDIYFTFFSGNKKEYVLLPLILDTGANVILLDTIFAKDIGFKFKNKKGKTAQENIDTGSGTITAYKYMVPEITSLDFGIEVFDFEIMVHDTPIEPSEYVGYVGVNFFKDKKICVDLLNKTLDIT